MTRLEPAQLRRVYVTVILFCLTVFAAEIMYRLVLRKPPSFSHTFTHKVGKTVTPDVIVLRFGRWEPFAASASSGVQAIRQSTDALRQQLAGNPGLKVWPDRFSMDKAQIITSAGVAPVFRVNATVDIEIAEMSKVQTVVSAALAAGFNKIEVTEQRVSDSIWIAARKQAQEAAQQEIKHRVDQVAAGLGIRIRQCGLPVTWVTVPPGDPSLGAGMSSMEASDVVPVESLIRPLDSLVEPEPEFKGVVYVAPTVILKPVEVSGEAVLNCEFAI
jgi:hypothetical protein